MPSLLVPWYNAQITAHTHLHRSACVRERASPAKFKDASHTTKEMHMARKRPTSEDESSGSTPHTCARQPSAQQSGKNPRAALMRPRRQTQTLSTQLVETHDSACPIVRIGASAGGLDALEKVFTEPRGSAGWLSC